jgi:hypothetical protein
MDPSAGSRGGGGNWKEVRTWEDPALPTIKTDWVQQVRGSPSGLVQSAPVHYRLFLSSHILPGALCLS